MVVLRRRYKTFLHQFSHRSFFL